MDKIQTQNRVIWVDTAKGIGLLLVMLGHLHVPYLSTWIYTFHMPLFFFLSGVVFSGTKYNFKEFTVKRIKSLVIPYFSLGIVIYLFYVILNLVLVEENGLYGSNWEMLKNLFVQKHFWTIWFLACLFYVEILYYWIWKKFSKWKLATTVVSVAICIVGLVRYRFGYESLPWNFDVALVAQLFFHAGYCFKCNRSLQKCFEDRGKKVYFCMVMLLMINVITGFLCIRLSGESLDMSIGMYGNEILSMMSAFAGILFIVLVAERIDNKYLTYLGQNTMILFAWHSRIVIVLCSYFYNFIGLFPRTKLWEQVLYSGVTLVIIFIVLIPINEAIKRTKLCHLFGVGGNKV